MAEERMFTVTIEGKEYKYPRETTYEQIAADFQKDYGHRIVLVYMTEA